LTVTSESLPLISSCPPGMEGWTLSHKVCFNIVNTIIVSSECSKKEWQQYQIEECYQLRSICEKINRKWVHEKEVRRAWDVKMAARAACSVKCAHACSGASEALTEVFERIFNLDWPVNRKRISHLM
jgi:hypothetical protein